MIYIAICLLFSAVVVYGENFLPSVEPTNKQPLRQVFSDVGKWEGITDQSLTDEVTNYLNLDDYLFRSYKKDDIIVSLYIGYYRTTAKIGDSHSPLVCFPGQGWDVSNPQSAEVETNAGQVNATSMTVEKGSDRQLLIFWFQSYDMTSGGTFWQKIHNLWGRVNLNPEDNAFIRVSAPIIGDNNSKAFQYAEAFVEEFYPLFLNYIIQ